MVETFKSFLLVLGRHQVTIDKISMTRDDMLAEGTKHYCINCQASCIKTYVNFSCILSTVNYNFFKSNYSYDCVVHFYAVAAAVRLTFGKGIFRYKGLLHKHRSVGWQISQTKQTNKNHKFSAVSVELCHTIFGGNFKFCSNLFGGNFK